MGNEPSYDLFVCLFFPSVLIYSHPSGMLKIVKQHVKIHVYVMIRPRGGDFLYSDFEFDVMKQDIQALKAAGARWYRNWHIN